MIPEYIPYIKYVISPGTRFERDKKVLFDPDGDVTQGKPLSNYGWAPSGLKELVEALYKARKGSLNGFEKFYNAKVLRSSENIVDALKNEHLIDENFPALIRIKIKEGIEVPALLVNIDNIYFKRCSQCKQSWKIQGAPENFVKFLKGLELERVTEIFQCTRQLCKFLCENYDNCEKNYTSTEGLKGVEEEKIECLKELFMLLAQQSSGSRKYECIPKEQIPSKLGCRELTTLKKELPLDLSDFRELVSRSTQINCSTCIERALRFDFKPLRYFFFDYKTWMKMQNQRYCKTPGQRNIDALPTKLLSEFIDSYEKYLDGTQLVAPINHKGVLEAFLNVSNVQFELKHELKHACKICGYMHQISGIPIKAMFRDSEVFKHEAFFADLLWNKLWEKRPIEFCESFEGKTHIRISESAILKREMKVEEIFTPTPFASSSYDYAVNLSKLGIERLILFDLTTGLWKKSGFHEVGRTAEEYVEIWKELLFNIPKKLPQTYAVWHIVVNSTEEMFFDGTAPHDAKDMKELLEIITSGNNKTVITVKCEEDIRFLNLSENKLIVVPIFNTTQAKGEARWEIKRLQGRKYEKLVISHVVDKLFS
jgi:hypothetical protein